MIFETEKEAMEWLERNKIHFSSTKSAFKFEVESAVYLKPEFAKTVKSHLDDEKDIDLQKALSKNPETFLDAVNMFAESFFPDKLKR
jgi:hypothetical protein